MSRRATRALAFLLAGVSTIACSSFGEQPSSSSPPAADAGLLGADTGAADATSALDYVSVVLEDKPLAYWRLGEAVGNFVARDEMKNRDGQYDGCVLGLGGAVANDTAARFVADLSSLAIPQGFDFGGQAPFSIEAWIAPASSNEGFRHAFTQVSFDANGREGFALLLDDGRFAFERFVHDNNDGKVVAPIRARTDGFSHVVATYDGTTMRLYVDGNTMGANPDARALPAKATPVVIGASGKGQQVVDGLMDEVAVYGSALSVERIKAHRQAGLAR